MSTQAGTMTGKTQQASTSTRLGTVETDGRNKTRKVVIKYRQKHVKYGKFLSRSTVLHVHDENNESRRGDIVEIKECRPISKTKCWTLVRIVERRSEKLVDSAGV